MQVAMDTNIENYDLTCPITLELLRDPVIATDGRVYEREAIIKWILAHGTSPFTRQPLRIEDLQPNEHLRRLAARRRNSTVSYNAHDDMVTLPPLRPMPRVYDHVTPGLIDPVVRNRTSNKYSLLCIRITVSIVCILVCLGVFIGLVVGLSTGATSSFNGGSGGGYTRPSTYAPVRHTCNATNVSGVNTMYSSALAYNSTTFFRTGGNRGMFYYEAIQVNVNISGIYTLTSNSTIDTYGYLYINYFNTSSLSTNLLLQDDDCGGLQQFHMEYSLQLNSTYILIGTTYAPNVTGAFSVIVVGPAAVTLL